MEYAAPSCLPLWSQIVRVTRLSNENSSSSNRAPTFAICMSSFSLCEALRHLIAKSLILFGSCKHFESEFNPDGPKKINSPHLIPHPELMERGTLGVFFFGFFCAHDSALWDLQKGQTAKQHIVAIVEFLWLLLNFFTSFLTCVSLILSLKSCVQGLN